MPKKNSPLLLKISIFLTKLKKPTIPKLIFLKKTRMTTKVKVLKQYNHYGYVKEYEYSPSSTPLIQFQRKPRKGRISLVKLYAKCLGKCQNETDYWEVGLEALPSIESGLGIDLLNTYGEDDSVDERAERFIQRFYEEMRRQRLESVL
ncbi:hypothetical protein CDL12_20490 [Handroanthus impetiginosus]|uniref:Uncharacterized protein n=1 Tax=Handroanthus impetiginosus TaxID=429701 RepID=A0A2G9G0D9_9LAMI|nr:hypothetical protein CDL12_28722 [Handroanthus impetiginosus]PIN06947.1 hypothetical protein CDL12_20490 [Handroanthus impetiginosus]